jgi:hypothetical protein
VSRDNVLSAVRELTARHFPVRARPRELRRVREPPRRLKRDERRPDTGKPQRGVKRSKRRAPKPSEGDDDAPRKRREDREPREAH